MRACVRACVHACGRAGVRNFDETCSSSFNSSTHCFLMSSRLGGAHNCCSVEMTNSSIGENRNAALSAPRQNIT